MSLEESRAQEERVRGQLIVVRASLAAAVAAVKDAARAKESIAAEATTKAGAYREAADERLGNLRDQIAAGVIAATDRERLRREEGQLLVQLEQARLDMETAGVRRVVLPTLVDIPHAAPCGMKWNDMAGDGDVRICTRCKKNVRNVAMLEARDAAEVPTSDPNAPFFRRFDGTIIAGDCSAGSSARKLGQIVSIAIFSIAICVAFPVLILAQQHAPGPTTTEEPPAPSFKEIPSASPPLDPNDLTLSDPILITITDSSRLPDHTFVSKVTPAGDAFRSETSCRPDITNFWSVSSSRVHNLLVALNRYKKSAISAQCDAESDRPITIDIQTTQGITHLAFEKCVGRWSAENALLELEPASMVVPAITDPTSIDQRYKELVDSMYVDACLLDPPKPRPHIPGPPPRPRIQPPPHF